MPGYRSKARARKNSRPHHLDAPATSSVTISKPSANQPARSRSVASTAKLKVTGYSRSRKQHKPAATSTPSVASNEHKTNQPDERQVATNATAATIVSTTQPIQDRSGYSRRRPARLSSNVIISPTIPAAQSSAKSTRRRRHAEHRPRRQLSSSTRFKIFITSLATMGVLLLAGTWVTYRYIFEDLPSVTELKQKPLASSSIIVDRNGTPLYSLYDDENRTIVPLSGISTRLIEATVAIEDKDFFSHHGFSPRGIARAFTANIQGDSVQGGSTITQQLVKNRLLSNEKTYTRKLREIVLSVMVERSYNKEQILEMYLNTVAYGGSTYGIEAAAQRYFHKPASELTLGESALLAGLPQAPSIYSPYGPNPELAKQRQSEVLRRMVEDGYISEEQAAEARQEELAYKTDATEILAPHFVMYVRQLLAEKYGEELLTTGGLTVKTTLDLPLQEQTQKIVTDEVTSLRRLRIKNGAALVTNPQTGEILAMVGSIDYFDFANDGQVNVVLRPRQPGSSIKPLTYSLALERGMTVTSTIEDAPVSYVVAGSPPYAPKNYDGKYHGRVMLKEALASSYNIPAVKLLAMVGINAAIDRAEAMGITTWKDRSRFGLSLTLGGGEVRMIDLAALYGVFANGGYRVDPQPILEVTDKNGQVLYRNECALDRSKCARSSVLDGNVAYLITNILSDNKSRSPAFGPLSTLYIPGQEVAVKTGTTNNLRDNWTVGYTSDRVVAVWVGNNDNVPMSYVASGITGASPIWNKIIRTQLDPKSPHVFATPSGMVRTAGCGNTTVNYFIAGSEPKNGCRTPTPNLADKADSGTLKPSPTPTATPRARQQPNRRPDQRG